jgi:hypothetical protein
MLKNGQRDDAIEGVVLVGEQLVQIRPLDSQAAAFAFLDDFGVPVHAVVFGVRKMRRQAALVTPAVEYLVAGDLGQRIGVGPTHRVVIEVL